MDESRAEISDEESVEGVRVCPTSQDIWSVGVVALEMATGSHPFSEGEKNELVTGQDRAINVPNTLSKALQHFISSCLIEDAAATNGSFFRLQQLQPFQFLNSLIDLFHVLAQVLTELVLQPQNL